MHSRAFPPSINVCDFSKQSNLRVESFRLMLILVSVRFRIELFLIARQTPFSDLFLLTTSFYSACLTSVVMLIGDLIAHMMAEKSDFFQTHKPDYTNPNYFITHLRRFITGFSLCSLNVTFVDPYKSHLITGQIMI